ncbi:MAG: tryptophan--tRNA ligase [Candidatus Marinimicrobia bacterium]|nr:tryptophan--tRNA ligase [Candidatus Neomarinimicrobiota bacterium]
MGRKKVFSGIQPSGDIHIGNYLGAIKAWVKNQEDFDNIFCVVDLHAITVSQDPKELKQKIRETAGILIASGIDPEKSSLFVQSHISAHSELAWILNCFTPMGWMERMTQFKEKSEGQKERVSVGLFDYPVLMSADILLYDTEIVPVGEDQIQHVELARDIAKRFNSIYGDTFTIPKGVIAESGARIMGLQKPENKMSKSDKGENNLIRLLDSPDDIISKISKAPTDSEISIVFDKGRAGVYNLLTIYKLCSGLSEEEIEKKFEGKGYADLKKDLADVIIQEFKPIQERYKDIMSDNSSLDKILKKGKEKVEPIAEKKLQEIKTVIGLD